MAVAVIPLAALGIGLAACGGSPTTTVYIAPSPTSPAPATTWTTACDVVGPGQFELFVTNNSSQGQTPPGWTVVLYDNGAVVGTSDQDGIGPVLGGPTSASPYAGPGQTVHSNVWNMPVAFTNCSAEPYDGGGG